MNAVEIGKFGKLRARNLSLPANLPDLAAGRSRLSANGLLAARKDCQRADAILVRP